MKDIFVSVIIPVYNSDCLLEKCLNSVIEQDFKNIEIILIDDGSTDSSGKICDAYTNLYSNVKVFHVPNKGVSIARNIGLDNAIGDWILFVDSDDYLDKSYISSFFKDGMLDETELIQVGYKYVSAAGKILKYDDTCDYFCNLREDIFVCPNKNLHPSGVVACKLLNRGVIEKNNLRFDEKLSFREDTLFVFKYLLCPEVYKFKFIGVHLYNYVYWSDASLSKKKRNFNDYFSQFIAIRSIASSVALKFWKIKTFRIYFNGFAYKLFLPFLYLLYLEGYNAKCRISILKKIKKEEMNRNYFPRSFFGKIFKYIYIFTPLRIFDIVMSLGVRIKNKLIF